MASEQTVASETKKFLPRVGSKSGDVSGHLSFGVSPVVAKNHMAPTSR
jgi:hypothetical protein